MKNEINDTLNAGSENIWNILKTGDDVQQWLPFVATCDLQGEGVGAKRVCTTSDGGTISETIVNIDHDNMIFEYSIDNHDIPMPVTNIKGILQVKDNDGKANLNWAVTFDLTQEMAEEAIMEMQSGMKASMKEGFDGLEKLAKLSNLKKHEESLIRKEL